MEKRFALISGANKGIGFEIAQQLGLKGFHVFVAARDVAKGKEAVAKLAAKGISVNFVKMDIENLKTIQAAFDEVKKQTDTLEILINNAAILSPTDRSLITISPDIMAHTLHTNLIGAMLVCQVFDPLIKSGSRVINISSGGGSMSESVGGWSPVYCISKSALNSYTRQLASEYSRRQISVNAICPGWVKTDMGGSGASHTVEKVAETAVWLATEADKSISGKWFRDKKEIPW